VAGEGLALDKAAPKPEVYYDQIDPDADGNAVLWHRSRADADRARSPSAAGNPKTLDWKSVRLEDIPTYPHRIIPCLFYRMDVCYGTGEDYVGTFFFDPKTGRDTYCGPPSAWRHTRPSSPATNSISVAIRADIFSFFDPTQPWTLERADPPTTRHPTRAPRPAIPVTWVTSIRPHALGSCTVPRWEPTEKSTSADSGCATTNGGGFGWYDPGNRKMDGFWQPLSGYAVHWITPAMGGRLIVISTTRAADEQNNNKAPDEARLFVFDVAAQKIVSTLAPQAKGRTTGLIAETSAGRLLGLAPDQKDPKSSILYGLDVSTGEMLFSKYCRRPSLRMLIGRALGGSFV